MAAEEKRSCNHLCWMMSSWELSSPVHVGAESIWVCICPDPERIVVRGKKKGLGWL